tara:strand:- start:3590 stop:3850 length:261 start_codon:yes stop_codon:yes gene_type:complete
MPIQADIEVKSPYDSILMQIFRSKKKRKKLSRIEKAYFSQLMAQGYSDLLKFDGMDAFPGIPFSDILVVKQYKKKTFFDWPMRPKL